METNESDFDVKDFKIKINLLKNDIKSLMEHEVDSTVDKDTAGSEKLKVVKVKNDNRKLKNSYDGTINADVKQDNVDGTISHDDQVRKYMNNVINKHPKRKGGRSKTILNLDHVEGSISHDDKVRKYFYDFDVYVSQREAKGKGNGSYLKDMANLIVNDQIGIDETQKLGLKQFATMSQSIKHLMCQICKSGPFTEDGIKQHNGKKHGNFEETCCSETFKSFWMYNRHMQDIHGFKCDHCDKIFAKLSQLKNHKKYVGPKTMTPCSICKREFNDIGNLRRHIRQVHTDLKPYKCDKCDLRYGDAGNLKRHIKGKHEGVRQQCKQCNQKVFIGTMTIHKQTFHSNKIFKCNFCHKDFRTRYGLGSHVNKSHKTIPTKYTCEICGENEFYTPQDKSKHKTAEHSENRVLVHRTYACSFCDAQFFKLKERNQHHISQHNEDTSGRFKCNFCNFSDVTENRIKYHIENICKRKIKKSKHLP